MPLHFIPKIILELFMKNKPSAGFGLLTVALVLMSPAVMCRSTVIPNVLVAHILQIWGLL
jgi:hypothetical protein